MKLHHLRYFVAIAGEQSIGAAARSLNVAQPALSRSLRELEKTLGVPLAERHGSGIALTAAGQIFLVRATRILEELRRSQEEAAQLRSEYQGCLTIGVSASVLVVLLPQIYRTFRRTFPAIEVKIFETMFPQIEPKLRNGTLDFFIGPRPNQPIDRGFQMESLWQGERVVVGRKNHPLADSESLSALLDEEWLVIGLHDSSIDELEEIFSPFGLPSPKNYTFASTLLSIHTLIISSNAVFPVPKICMSSPLMEHSVAAFPLKERLSPTEIVQIKRADLPLTPVADHFSTLLQRSAAHLLSSMK